MSKINNSIISTDRHVPWVEKYRPIQIDNIISHNEIIMSLKKFIEKKTLPHLLFFGPSGTGKTSTIKCCAREIYGKYIECMILELNASNERGIDTVRTKIKNFVGSKNNIFLLPENSELHKLVILDEIDSMTVEAQGMLRQTIEKNSKTTRFCLICNDIDKINDALQSRCASYRFSPLNHAEMKKRLKKICTIENLNYNDDALDTIIKISKGDMRHGINTLQHISITVKNKIESKHIYNFSGHCEPEIIYQIFTLYLKLSNKKISLNKCVDEVTNIVINNNVTIFNLLEELKNLIIDSKFNIDQKLYIIDHFSQNEIYDSVNLDPKIILMIIASIFVLV